MTTANAAAKTMTQTWQRLCTRADLVPFSGVAAWIDTAEGPAQVALFYIPCAPAMPGAPDKAIPGAPDKALPSGPGRELYALDHHDPIADANVIARGIVGDIQGEPVVASPLYKEHYRLRDGQCLEHEGIQLRTWEVCFKGDEVWIET